MAGSLCKPLCVTKEIEFTRCLGHGVKAHVLQAEWRGRNLVLKSTKPIREGVLATNFENETNHRKMTKAQFIRDVSILLIFKTFNLYKLPIILLHPPPPLPLPPPPLPPLPPPLPLPPPPLPPLPAPPPLPPAAAALPIYCSSSVGQYVSVPEPGWQEECPLYWLCVGDHLL